MHKPVRPKSAKGKNRSTHPIIQQSESRRKGPITTSSIFAPSSTSQLVRPGLSDATDRKHSIHNSHSSVSGSLSVTKDVSNETIAASSGETAATSEVRFPDITRPTSSLSKYHILPAISPVPHPAERKVDVYAEPPNGIQFDNDVDLLTERAQQMILDSAMQRSHAALGARPPSGNCKRKVTKIDVGLQQKRVKMCSTTPSPSFPNRHRPKEMLRSSVVARSDSRTKIPREPKPTENSLLIALKLPDGTRVERRFLPTTTVRGVLAYTHSQYPIVPVSQCRLFRMDVIPKKLLSERDRTLEQLQIMNRTTLYVEEDDEY